jgi:hypothetical protein
MFYTVIKLDGHLSFGHSQVSLQDNFSSLARCEMKRSKIFKKTQFGSKLQALETQSSSVDQPTTESV